MRLPRFQFRLWTIFAITALVGWAIVAVPYWVAPYATRYPTPLLDPISRMEMSPEKMRKYDEETHAQSGWLVNPRNSIKVLIGGTLAAAMLVASLTIYRFRHVPKDRADGTR
jgi:hypothetical protein